MKHSAENNPSRNTLQPTVVILSSVRWNLTWQRHQALAKEANNLGYKTIFVEPHPRGLKHLISWIHSKIKRNTKTTAAHEIPNKVIIDNWRILDILPGRRLRRIYCSLETKTVDLNFVYLPSKSNLKIVKSIRAKRIVYDKVIDWSSAPTNWFPPSGWRNIENEFEQMSRAGLVHLASDSPTVISGWKERGLSAQLVFPAADQEFIEFNWSANPITGPIGYFGSVRSSEIDIQLLLELSATYEIVVAGPVDDEIKTLLTNSTIRLVGPLRLDELVREMDTWRAVILPYRVNSRTDTLVPAKLWNALICPRPAFYSNLNLPHEIKSHFFPIDALHNFDLNEVEKKPFENNETWKERFNHLSGETRVLNDI